MTAIKLCEDCHMLPLKPHLLELLLMLSQGSVTHSDEAAFCPFYMYELTDWLVTLLIIEKRDYTTPSTQRALMTMDGCGIIGILIPG